MPGLLGGINWLYKCNGQPNRQWLRKLHGLCELCKLRVKYDTRFHRFTEHVR